MKLDNYKNVIYTLTGALCTIKNRINTKTRPEDMENKINKLNKFIHQMLLDFSVNNKSALVCPHCDGVTKDLKLLDTDTTIGELDYTVAGFRKITCYHCGKEYEASVRLYPMYHIKKIK